MSERVRIGQMIAEIRKEEGWSQTDLSTASGLDRGHIARIEMGQYNLSIDTLSKIAKAFGRTIELIKKRSVKR